MRHLRNSLYIFTEDAYLTVDGENVVAKSKEKEIGRIPLHTIENIFCFSYPGASPKLMGKCAESGIALSFFSPRGKFLARISGENQGNILLRRELYRYADDAAWSLETAKQFILRKVFNGRWVLERAIRDHGLRIDAEAFKTASMHLAESLQAIRICENMETLRGIEGEAASVYFSVFDEMILRDKDDFFFRGRVKRPATDRVNAILSFFYSILALDCASALEGVGLDPYCGIMHVDRPGRRSLALDLMEELRPVIVDRFVLSAINNRIIKDSDFIELASGEVRLNDAGRKKLLNAWQDRKHEKLVHPYLKEKIDKGLIPHVQALLLARYIRGDLDGYPPFLWK